MKKAGRRITLQTIVILLALVLPALGQSVRQSGNVTPGHVVQWLTTGVIGDGGPLGGGATLNGSFTLNDFVCANASGTTPLIVDCGLSATGTNNWIGLQNLQAGGTSLTRAANDSTTNIATTAFVLGTANAYTATQNFSGGITAPTRSVGDSTTNVATTAFVLGQTGGVTISGTPSVGYVPIATGATAAWGNSIPGPFFFTETQDQLGARFEVQKRSSPLNYGNTRAGFVFQITDTGTLGMGAVAPQAVFDMASSGNGNVTVSPNASFSAWEGLFAAFTKTGDGSGQAITITCQLGAVGATGYNECGGVESTAINIGSTNGFLTDEFLVLDGTSGTNFATRLGAVVARIGAHNSGSAALGTTAFQASSEGTQAINSIMDINKSSTVGFARGIDLAGVGYAGSGALFTSGVAVRLPNNNNISSLNAAGNADIPLIYLDGSNNVEIGALAGTPVFLRGQITTPGVTTGTPVASLCLDASNNIIKKTTAGSCI